MNLKPYRGDLIKASSMAVGLVIVITLLGQYIVPPYVFVTPGYSVYVAGIVDHKRIGQGYSNGGLHRWYTVSIRLFDDDPVNQIKGGATLAYIVTKAEWEMAEWGDTVKMKLLPDVKAEIVELFPSLKLPEWHGLSGSASPISIEIFADKTTYKTGEKAEFNVMVRNTPVEKGWTEPSIPLKLTLFSVSPFWAFRNGGRVFTFPGDMESQEIVLQQGQELRFSFNWQLTDVLEGVYYVRVYLGYFTENEETTLTGTTMIGVEA